MYSRHTRQDRWLATILIADCAASIVQHV